MSGVPVVPYWLGMMIQTGLFLCRVLDLLSCESRLIHTGKSVGYSTVSYGLASARCCVVSVGCVHCSLALCIQLLALAVNLGYILDVVGSYCLHRYYFVAFAGVADAPWCWCDFVPCAVGVVVVYFGLA